MAPIKPWTAIGTSYVGLIKSTIIDIAQIIVTDTNKKLLLLSSDIFNVFCSLSCKRYPERLPNAKERMAIARFEKSIVNIVPLNNGLSLQVKPVGDNCYSAKKLALISSIARASDILASFASSRIFAIACWITSYCSFVQVTERVRNSSSSFCSGLLSLFTS